MAASGHDRGRSHMALRPAHLKLKLLLLLLCGGGLAAYTFAGLPCPVRALTGVICPGCGMGRAWLAFLRLDISGAFFYHPLFWAVPLLVLFLLFDFRLLPGRRSNETVLGLLLLAVALCYAFRLIAFLNGKLPI